MPTVNRYRNWVRRVMSPTTIQGEVAERIAQVLGLVGDLLANMAVEAVYARSLDSETFPADALYLVGAERRMPRYAGETDAGYRRRLGGAWTARMLQGTAPAITNQLATLGMTAYVRDTRDWDWDGNAADWSRMWTVITGHPYQAWTFGEAYVFGGGQTWGSTATESELALLRAIVREWKPGHVRSSHIVLVYDSAGFDASQPDGTWANAANRFAAAAYVAG